jgi:hypothetical protein
MTNTNNTELLSNIPPELRAQRVWLQSHDKGPLPGLTYKTDKDKAENCRTLDDLLKRPSLKEAQRLAIKDENFIYIDLDHVRDVDTDETEPWALELIEQFNTYTERSRSGTGYHLVCRGTLPEDFCLGKPSQVELFSGNYKNKLIALTGDVVDLQTVIQDRQELASKLLKRVKRHGKVEGAQVFGPPEDWRKRFHTVDELPDGDICFLIENALPEGIAFMGALSGAGKTWVALSMARALTTGKPWLGIHSVPEPVEVLYLCPEMQAKTFKKRCRMFGIRDRFHCQTIADGMPMDLNDPVLESAITELKPVVFLDTAIRFTDAEDENSASQNSKGLGKAVFTLAGMGARAVVCLHHRSKAGAESEELTLENTLRGTTDFGALCDVVWGMQYEKGSTSQYAKESHDFVRLDLRCVKPRDFKRPPDLRIQLMPFINNIGDFAALEGTADGTANESKKSDLNGLQDAIDKNPSISLTKLEGLGVGTRRKIKPILDKAGYAQNEATGAWEQNGQPIL